MGGLSRKRDSHLILKQFLGHTKFSGFSFIISFIFRGHEPVLHLALLPVFPVLCIVLGLGRDFIG